MKIYLDHVRLRQILSRFRKILRIYLAPEDAKAQMFRHGPLFSEGWVEFAKKSVAKRVAHMLHGDQIGILAVLEDSVKTLQIDHS